MDFTFGIITAGGQEERIDRVIDSIENENIPNYEVLIVGDSKINRDKTTVINFDENARKGWITRKKNLITENASYDYIVYLTDYVALCPGWYEGMLKFGNDFKVMISPMIDIDGDRFLDWVVWSNATNPLYPAHPYWSVSDYHQLRKILLPYSVTHMSKHQYISGAYWVSPKRFMEEFPFDENLLHRESEDVEWSFRVRDNHDFSINTHCKAQVISSKKWNVHPVDEGGMKIINSLNPNRKELK